MGLRIAVASLSADGLEAEVSPHFGHCSHFTLIEVDGPMVCSVESFANPYLEQHQPGQIPEFIHSLGAQVMISGGMGGRAVAFFQQYGIEPATGAGGTVQETLARYLAGGLSGAAACAESVEHGQGHG